MDLSKVTAGRNPPKEIHAFIEIPFGGVPVKYELNKDSGALYVDRFLHTGSKIPHADGLPAWVAASSIR